MEPLPPPKSWSSSELLPAVCEAAAWSQLGWQLGPLSPGPSQLVRTDSDFLRFAMAPTFPTPSSLLVEIILILQGKWVFWVVVVYTFAEAGGSS